MIQIGINCKTNAFCPNSILISILITTKEVQQFSSIQSHKTGLLDDKWEAC